MAKYYRARLNHTIRRLAEQEVRTKKKIPPEEDLKPDEVENVAELCSRLDTRLRRKKNAAWGDVMASMRKIIRTAVIDFKSQSALMEACIGMEIVREDETDEVKDIPGCV